MQKIPRKVILNGTEILNLDSTSAQTTDVANGKTYYNINGYLVEGSDDTNSSLLGSINITENRAYTPEGEGQDVAGWDYINVNVIPKLQQKTVTPSESSQTITADYGKDGLSQVVVNRIPNEYIIPSGYKVITSNETVDVTSLKEVIVNVTGGSGVADTTSVTSVPISNNQNLIIHNASVSIMDKNTIKIGVI